MKFFSVIKKSTLSRGRLSLLQTQHGVIHAPFFMPIATRAAVKNISPEELEEIHAEIILSNTYHLLLRPGMELMKKYRGLHNFMNWKKPILTDSGGYQIFSLAKHRKIYERGVEFSDPQNGKKYHLSPESVAKIQAIIGSDIQMVLDVCPAYPCAKNYAEESMKLTTQWAKRCKKEFLKIKNEISKIKNTNQKSKIHKALLFGIIQGSIYKDLRIQCAKDLVKIGFDGYAIGGLAVGEPRKKMYEVLEWTIPRLPEGNPRYLMGVGRPEEIAEAVRHGIDMFDCVIPTREARHGRIYVWDKFFTFDEWLLGKKKKLFYERLDIYKSTFSKIITPFSEHRLLKPYTFAYLHHLFRTNEGLGYRLATLNNLIFYLGLMEKIRKAIQGEIL